MRLLTRSGIAERLEFGRELLEVDLAFLACTFADFGDADVEAFWGLLTELFSLVDAAGLFLLFLRGSNGRRPRLESDDMSLFND